MRETRRDGPPAAHGLPASGPASARGEAGREVAGGAAKRSGADDSDVEAAAAGSMSGSKNGSVSGSTSVNPLLLSGRGGLLETLTQSLQRGEGRGGERRGGEGREARVGEVR